MEIEKIKQAVCKEAGENPPDEVRTARDLVEETLTVFGCILEWAEGNIHNLEVEDSLDRIENLAFDLRNEIGK